MHLRVTVERLEGKNQIPIEVPPAGSPLSRDDPQERRRQRGRHKKQSGGHGQFGDVVIEIKPLPRGSGFKFTDTITGGVVPKQYIQSVETGIREYLKSGPLGFPVVDLAVNLSDGSYHAVDSSDMAFQMAAQHRHEGRHGAVLAGAARADHEGRDRHARRTPPPRSRRWCRSGAARSSATTRGRAGRAGTWSRRPCRSPRSAT